MRRVLIRSVTALLISLTVIFAAIGVGVYSLVGFSSALKTQDFTTLPGDLADCTSMVLDIENAQISENQGDFILGKREVYFSFTLQPDQNVSGIALDLGSIEDVLLGRQTCVIEVSNNSSLSVIEISSGDQIVDLASVERLGTIYAGNPMDIPLSSLLSKSLLIIPETELTGESTLELSGNVIYSQAQNVLLIAGISAAALALAALIFGWTTRKRSH